MNLPSYRHRYLPAMTPRAIAALPDKTWAPVILTTGAVEQHGPHMPVAVDSLMAQTWLSLALSRLPEDASCYVAPAITIGKSNEHTGFPGTLIISKDTLRAQVLAVARQVHAWGFRTLAVINTHGGNVPVLVPTLREVRTLYGMRAAILPNWQIPDQSKQEATFGIHAGEVETSWVLAAKGAWVDMEHAVCEFPASFDDPGQVRPVAAPALVAWTSKDVSRTGTMGDAASATAEKGERWLEAGARNYAQSIAEICRAGRRSAA